MVDVKELNPIALGKAAAEVQAFLGQFQALAVVGAALQEAGGIERRLVSLRKELADFPAKRQEIEDGIVKAAEEKVTSLRGQIEALTNEHSTLCAKKEVARKELLEVTAELETKRNEMTTIEEHIERLKAKFV